MDVKKAAVKKIPYGLSDYEKFVTGNYYYVDKTSYLRVLEEAGNYLFFIRPRRFGKTLFLSVMETYYNVAKKDQFDFFYRDTAIFTEPTGERNSYLILKFNFSAVNPDIHNVADSFQDYVVEVGEAFISSYHRLLEIDEEKRIHELKGKKAASDVLRFLIWLCRRSGQRLFVIVDEYDNFANTILSTSGRGDYQAITHGEGFFRAFFNVLKEGTSGSGAPIGRLFLTGVSPLTLDDVTSGYNIGENVSLDAAFNQILGFTGNDVREMLNYYQRAGLIKDDLEFLMAIIDEWYGSYLFSKYADSNERLYNSDMVLYFLKEYFKTQAVPEDLIDRNVRIDYEKLRHLIVVDRGEGKVVNGNFNRLREIIEQGEIAGRLVKGFSIEKLVDENNFVSLLFYFGLLTIRSSELNEVVLTIPNEAVRRLYYDYIREGYEETDAFALDLSAYSHLMKAMAMNGEWQPLFDFLTSRMRESMSLRDLITGEKSVQAFLSVYLGLSNLYIIHTERELNKGYADIVMEPFLAVYKGIRYAYALEIKYIKRGKKTREWTEAEIRRLQAEAEAQLKHYTDDEKLRKSIQKTTMTRLVLIFSGHELLYINEIKDPPST